MFFCSRDRVLSEALAALLDQAGGFHLLEDPVACSAPDTIILDADSYAAGIADLCRDLRRSYRHSSILLLASTPGDTDGDAIHMAGADDALHKPVKIQELVNSIRLQVKNHQWLSEEPVVIGGLVFLPAERMIRDDKGSEVLLTTLETRLLHRLYRASGKGVRRQVLLTEVWGYSEGVKTTTVQSYIHRLRSKLREFGHAADVIVSGADGYRLASPQVLPEQPRNGTS